MLVHVFFEEKFEGNTVKKIPFDLVNFLSLVSYKKKIRQVVNNDMRAQSFLGDLFCNLCILIRFLKNAKKKFVFLIY
jgi:hypothetical protein